MPNIILDSVRGPQPVPIDDMFLKKRKIFLVEEVNERLVSIIAERTGKTVKQVSKVTMSENWSKTSSVIVWLLI